MLALVTMVGTAMAWSVAANPEGHEVWWDQPTLEFVVNTQSSPVPEGVLVETLEAATRQWEAVPGPDVRFVLLGTTEEREAAADDLNVIWFEPMWRDAPDQVALTHVWSASDGQIVGFDLAFNVRDHVWATDGDAHATDLLNTLTHELGHALGLDHDHAHPEATMYATTLAGETIKRDLAADDVEGLQAMYGAPFVAQDLTDITLDPQLGCATAPTGAPRLWVGALLLGLLAGRRARR